MERYIQTVRGRVPATAIGFTLPHEHTYCELWRLDCRYDYLGQLTSEDILVSELSEYSRRGGSCLVDVTVRGIGRNPVGALRLAERSGLHIVLGTGYYRQPYYPPDAQIDRRSVESLADEMVREFQEGIDDTGIKVGIIGEIGADKTWVSAQEERVGRAAARAQQATGLAITTHSVLSRVGLEQLKIFLAEGADAERIVIGHCDWYPDLNYYLEILSTGASIQFDIFGHLDSYTRGLEPIVLDLVRELLDRHKEHQILLSQDVAFIANVKRFGGNGYSHLREVSIPKLRELGVPQHLVDIMTIANPRRLLTVEA
jgi:phosphotriesterase-related protein